MNLHIMKLDKSNEKDSPKILNRAQAIYKFFEEGYAKIGGFLTFKDYKAMLKGIERYKFAKDFDQSNKSVAISIYTTRLEGYKCVGITSDGTSIGKEGVKEIIKEDINQYYDFYWAECSGAIEHYFEKFGGFKIPAIYVKEIINKDVNISEDGYHYERPIGPNKEYFKKIIYGIPNKDIAKKIILEIRKYEGLNSIKSWIEKLERCIKEDVNFDDGSIMSKKPKEDVLKNILLQYIDHVNEYGDAGYDLSKWHLIKLKNTLIQLKIILKSRNKDKKYNMLKGVYDESYEIYKIAIETSGIWKSFKCT